MSPLVSENPARSDKLAAICAIVLKHLPAPGNYATALKNIRILRRDQPTTLTRYFCTSCCVLIVQGQKQMIYDNRRLTYGCGQYLIANAAVPVTGRIATASPTAPCTGIELDFDPAVMSNLIYEHAIAADTLPDEPSVTVSNADPELLDAFLRLAILLDKPAAEQRILTPLITREICYRLLTGPQRGQLRRIYTPGSRSGHIAQAIVMLQERFDQKINIETLASAVNMSTSAFYRSFKTITTLSPLQYQKQLRLEEARRLMLSENCDAASASFRVGYESPAQFNREYKKLFGNPPRTDIQRLTRIQQGLQAQTAIP